MPPKRLTDPLKIQQRLFDGCMPEPMSGCWIWLGSIKKNGYGNSHHEVTRKTESAHRRSYRLHKGPIPSDMLVLHKCDVRCCINPEHLFLGTYSDNLNDMVAKGRNKPNNLFGTRNPASKLTAADVDRIRSTPKKRGFMKRLATELGVNRGTIERVVSGKSWSHAQN